MASYDSDSSEGEFQETNVLLGYASKEEEEGEDTISHLGGRPEWMEADKAPSAALARCKVCGDLMVLLLQLNGELPERFPGHDRRIYVFGCRRATCRRRDGTIRALRGVRVWKEETSTKSKTGSEKEDEPEEATKKENKGPGLGDTLFGAPSFGGSSSGQNPFSSGGSNPFSSGGSNPFSSPGANPFSSSTTTTEPAPTKPRPTEQSASSLSKTFAETLSINTPPAEPTSPAEPWPATDAQPPAYPTLYLFDAEFETLDPTPTKTPANARIESADAEEPSMLDREAFESTMDAAFQKFADRLSQNPDQVIRYEFGGTPLLYSKTDAVGKKLAAGNAAGMPGCPNCGGRRTFEVQMTPNAIAELEENDMSLEGMEWGTIIVGVCEKDCRPRVTEIGEAGYLEEWVGVQWEELVNRK